MTTVVKGDVTKASEHAIIHQVNCCNVMGSGVARSIRALYPQHYIDFINDKRNPYEKLGSFVASSIGEKVIYGLYGQLNYGRRGQYTDYDAFLKGMHFIAKDIKEKGFISCAMPYGIGCGLGGGKWPEIERILNIVSTYHNIDITLYQYD